VACKKEQIITTLEDSILTKLDYELLYLADPVKALTSRRFFKTGKGQYGEGNRFLGINVPTIHKLSKKYKGLPLDNIIALLRSPFHEVRLLSLFILIIDYESGDRITKSKIASLYFFNTKYINNWDLVDASCPQNSGRLSHEQGQIHSQQASHLAKSLGASDSNSIYLQIHKGW